MGKTVILSFLILLLSRVNVLCEKGKFMLNWI